MQVMILQTIKVTSNEDVAESQAFGNYVDSVLDAIFNQEAVLA